MRSLSGYLALCAAASLLAVGCSSTDDSIDGTHQSVDAGPDAGLDAGQDAGTDAGEDAGVDAGSEGDGGVVFFFQVSPDLEPVDVFVGTTEVGDDLGFGELTAAIPVEPGTTTLDLFAHEAGSARPSGAPLASLTTTDIAAGTRNLAIATGFATPTGSDPALQLVVLEDGFTPPATNMVKVRGVHASPDAPALDLGAIVPVVGFFALQSNVAFATASAAEGIEVPAQPVTLAVRPSGQTTPTFNFSVSPTAGQALFGVAAGAFTPEGSEAPFQLILIDTSVLPWVATPVLPD